MVYLFYTTYISVGLAQHEIYRAKVGKGGINIDMAESKSLNSKAKHGNRYKKMQQHNKPCS